MPEGTHGTSKARGKIRQGSRSECSSGFFAACKSVSLSGEEGGIEKGQGAIEGVAERQKQIRSGQRPYRAASRVEPPC